MIPGKAALKRWIISNGADLCGIAPIARFSQAPQNFHPRDIFPDCNSIIVFATAFPHSTLQAKTNTPYTFVRNMMVDYTDRLSFNLSRWLEKQGSRSIPIPSAAPYDYWDEENKHGRAILSLKHAAHLAGLGFIGKNTLLINEIYGNMIWLGAVLTDAKLTPDPLSFTETCPEDCTLCLNACPLQALDGTTIRQKLCRSRSISVTEGGGWVLSCNLCRKVCPNLMGIRNHKWAAA